MAPRINPIKSNEISIQIKCEPPRLLARKLYIHKGIKYEELRCVCVCVCTYKRN